MDIANAAFAAPFIGQMAAITFPTWLTPEIFSIGPVAIRWYSLGYIVGILIAWNIAKRMVANARLWGGPAPITAADLDDFLFWAVIGIVAGGRIGYVLFYDFTAVLAEPMRALRVWEGGMSFHGGLIGTTLAMVLFARSRGFSPWRLFDLIACVAPIGIGLVRVANFINSELWGGPTELPFGVIFPNDPLQLPRHPSQLYEAFLEGLVLYIVLRIASHVWLKLKNPRFITGLFIAGYGLSRIAVEFVRVPDAHIGYLFGGWLTMGMVLSLPMVLLGLALIATQGKTDISTAETTD